MPHRGIRVGLFANIFEVQIAVFLGIVRSGLWTFINTVFKSCCMPKMVASKSSAEFDAGRVTHHLMVTMMDADY